MYGVCKNALQQVAHQLAGQRRISLAWGRIFYLYGPYEATSRFVPSVICALLREQAVACTDGRQLRDYSHVQDIADAFVALLASGVQGAVNVGSGQPVSLRSLGTFIEQALRRPGLIQWNARVIPENDPALLVADTRRLNGEVGWQPKFSLTDGLTDTVKWWQEHLQPVEGS
jgi:nucleoside-diphosphate-sugar epimerase